MEQDFTDRVQDYQRIYNVGIRQTEAPGLYKYYSTQRPVDIGTFPKPPYNKPDEIFNYDQRVPVENGSFLAWGYLTYTRPLTEKQHPTMSCVLRLIIPTGPVRLPSR